MKSSKRRVWEMVLAFLFLVLVGLTYTVLLMWAVYRANL